MILLILVSFFLPGLSQENTSPEIRVLLKRLNLTDRLDLTPEGSYLLSGNGFSMTLHSGNELTIQVRSGNLYLFSKDTHMRLGSEVSLDRYDGADSALRLNGASGLYPGNLRLYIQGGLLQAVLSLPIESYLRGVLPYEMGEGFPIEALKAQAVCARTYAITHLNPKRAYDVVDTTNDQVYRGTGKHPDCDRAILETAGVIGTRNGSPVMCYYSASNGGQTEIPEHVWPGTDSEGIYAITDDPYDLANPQSLVKRAFLPRNAQDLPEEFFHLIVSGLQKDLVRLGYSSDPSSFHIDEISSVSLSGQSGQRRFVTTLNLTLRFSGRKPVSLPSATPRLAGGTYGDDDDMLFFVTDTPAPLKDTLGPFESCPEPVSVSLPLFPDVVRMLSLSIYGADNELITVREESKRFILEARRYGHGVGMSQRGAQYMAEHEKWKYDQILAFYYPGMTLGLTGSALPALPTLHPDLSMTPGPAASPTPRPTLMPVTADDLPEGTYIASVEGIDDDSSLNLRSEPGLSSEILMRLYKHQKLIVLESCEDPEWVHVRTDVIEGYVMVSFLEKTESLPSVPPDSPILPTSEDKP